MPASTTLTYRSSCGSRGGVSGGTLDASLIMTRVSAGRYDDTNISLLLNLELKRQERRRQLRLQSLLSNDDDNYDNRRTSLLKLPHSSSEQYQSGEQQKAVSAKAEKDLNFYAKELEQWLKKMKCTGATGVTLEQFAELKVGVLDTKVDPCSSPCMEPYPSLAREKFVYKGVKDANGRLKGRAELEFENGDTLCGMFHNGMRHGECRVETGRKNLRAIIGNYTNDQLSGRAKVIFADGDWLEGYFCEGILHGFTRRFDPKGRLTFVGNYQNGIPYGVCWRVIRGGGVVVGRADRSGELTGMRIAYLYTDFKTAFVGTFENGFLEAAQVARLKTVIDVRGIKVPIFTEPTGPMYKREVANFERLTTEPLLRDPYESQMVDVYVSKVEGAHDGLFSRQKIEPNVILAFYNGIRLPEGRTIDEDDWVKNAYKIFDPTRKNGTIDIPTCYWNFEDYCATCAHKTNHSFMPNAEFVAFDHPRFGLVPCLLSTHDIAAGEEIFVHYGYELNGCPDWYEEAWLKGSYPVPESLREWWVMDDGKRQTRNAPELVVEPIRHYELFLKSN